MKRFNEKGITLISLAVTIIILLILGVVVLVNTVGIDGIINKTESSKESYQVKEDRELIEIAKQEIAHKNEGDIPKDGENGIKEKLRSIRFDPIEDLTKEGIDKDYELDEDEFLVKCREHKDHYYKVSTDETIYLGSLKDIPIIKIGTIEVTDTEYIIPVTVKCENGIKNITLPELDGKKGKKVEAKNYEELYNGRATKDGKKYTEISFEYSTPLTGKYIFKATSLSNTTSKKTVTIGPEELRIEFDPNTWTINQ